MNTAEIIAEEILIETPGAILVLYEGDKDWIPLGAIKDYNGNQGDKDVALDVDQRVLEEKGMV